MAFYGFTGAGGNELYPASTFGRGYGPMQTMNGPNNTILWFDSVHFSELLQDHFSQYVYNVLEAPVYWGHLAVQPFVVARGQNAVLRQELYPLANLDVGTVYPFIGASYIPQERASFVEGKLPHTHGWNGTVGFGYRCLDHWSIGIAGGYNRNFFEEPDTLGHYTFHLNSWITSLLSGLQFDRGYLNGIFNVGAMWVDIDRKFCMGPQQWSAKGHTRGIQYDLLLEGGGYFYQSDLLQLGPLATIEYQRAGVNGYSERNAAYNDLQYKHQHANSCVTGIGLEALVLGQNMARFHGFSIELLAQANEEWIHGKRTVYFRQQSLDDAPYGAWPIYRERSLFGSFALNIAKTFSNEILLHVGYRGNWGQHHMSEQNLTMSLSRAF